MSEQIVRLTAADYDEALDFLNLVFSMAGRPHDFQAMLPVMWERDDEHVGKHFAIKRDGKIRAMVGVYPLPIKIAGRELVFSTMGNVATHPYDTGKGYMSRLLERANQEMDDLNLDASRLGGLRQRYNRYGFEPGGSLYRLTLTRHNLLRVPQKERKITFAPIGEQDSALLAVARKLFEKNGMAVCRPGDRGFYKTLRAWRNVPYAALDEQGKMIGYLTGSADGADVSEQAAVSPEALLDMLVAWIEQRNLEKLSFTLPPWQLDEIAICRLYCESWSVGAPSMFYIRRWDRVLEALLALKAGYEALPEGEAVVEIQGYGRVKLSITEGVARCERTEEAPCVSLDRLAAVRFFMGPIPPSATARVMGKPGALLNAWLPLPLSWDTLDRV